MRIEFLYSDLCNLYGDRGNFEYLIKCFNKPIIYYTNINDEPKFVKEKIDIIYMGSTTESNQEKMIKLLTPYRELLKYLIDNNTIFLLTGNSFEIFGKYITDYDKKIECLNLIDIYSERIIPKRFNEIILGKFNDIEIVGYTSRFSHSYGNSDKYLFNLIKGKGFNLNTNLEGVRVNNLFGTYLLGPLLIQNPLFTQYLIKLTKNGKLYLKKDIINAYDVRLEEIKNI